MILYIIGTDYEAMANFVDWVCESLVGWPPFVNDEFTISDPQDYEDRYVVVVTIGDHVDDSIAVLNYDEMFLGKDELHKVLAHIDR